MNIKNYLKQSLVALAALVLVFGPVASAQPLIQSSTQTVNLAMDVNQTITQSISVTVITFTYDPVAHTGTASAPLVITTNANLQAGQGIVSQGAWLGSATAALTGQNAGGLIPSSEVFAQATEFGNLPCTGNAIFSDGVSGQMGSVAGAICGVSRTIAGYNGYSVGAVIPVVGANNLVTTLTLSLANLPALTPDHYTGVLSVESYSE